MEERTTLTLVANPTNASGTNLGRAALKGVVTPVQYEFCDVVRDRIAQGEVAGFDEVGLRVAGTLY